MLVTAADSILCLDLLQWLLLFSSVGGSRADECQSRLELVLIGAWQIAIKQEATLPCWLLGLAVLEVVG